MGSRLRSGKERNARGLSCVQGPGDGERGPAERGEDDPGVEGGVGGGEGQEEGGGGKANRFSDQLQIEAKEKEAFVKMSYDFQSSDKLDLLLENQDLKTKLAARVEKEMEMVRELEQVKTEKKILEQTVLCEIQSKRREQRGGEFESIFEEMEDFLLRAFFIRPIQGMAPHLVIPVEATV